MLESQHAGAQTQVFRLFLEAPNQTISEPMPFRKNYIVFLENYHKCMVEFHIVRNPLFHINAQKYFASPRVCYALNV